MQIQFADRITKLVLLGAVQAFAVGADGDFFKAMRDVQVPGIDVIWHQLSLLPAAFVLVMGYAESVLLVFAIGCFLALRPAPKRAGRRLSRNLPAWPDNPSNRHRRHGQSSGPEINWPTQAKRRATDATGTAAT